MKFGIALLLLGVSAVAETQWETAGQAWWSHIRFLADDSLEGRNVGSAGYEKAADYVSRQFEQAGLKPGAGSTYSQPVDFTKIALDEPASQVMLVRDGTAIPVVLGDDVLIGAGIKAADIDAPLVFAGYGLEIPEAGYSDLKDPALRGAIAVYLAGGPANVAGNLRSHHSSGEERTKALLAAGVVGTVAIANPRNMDLPWSRQRANRLQARMVLSAPAFSGAGVRFSAAWNPAKADRLFEGSGHTMAELLDAADHDRPLPYFTLQGRLRAHTATRRDSIPSRNVIAIRPGTDSRLKNEYVIISAHLDHLGLADTGADRIFNGAMDDASGVASLIEIAKALKAGQVRTKRSLAFLAVTGEEKGDLGSHYFAERPTFKGKIVADINMDMFLPLFPLRYLEVQGLDESTLGDDIRVVASAAHVEIQADKEPNANRFIRSDQYSFIRKGVPALAFKFGWIPGSPEEKIFKDWYQARYHAVSDDLTQPVDMAAAAQFDALLTALVERVANAGHAPQWKPESFFRRFATAPSASNAGR